MKFGIQNFRVFDKEGSTVNIKPITLLTGANSSGKSSMTKALLLLEDFLSQYAEKKQIGQCVLNFSSDRFRLGNYSNVLNRKTDADGRIVFSYIKHSDFLNLDAKVSLSFTSNPNDQEGKGHFDSCEIESLEGVRFVAIRMKEGSDFEGNMVVKPSYDVDVPYLRKLYFERFSSINQLLSTRFQFERKGIGAWNAGDDFCVANKIVILKQIELRTLFLFDRLRDVVSFEDGLSFVSMDDDFGELKEYLPQVKKMFKESGKSDFLSFFSDLEEKSPLHYLGSFPMGGSISPFGSFARTGKVLDVISGPGMSSHYEYKALSCDAQDPFNFVLGVLALIHSHYSLDSSDDLSSINTIDGELTSFKVFTSFLNNAINELLFPRFVNHLQFVPSDKVSIRRLYDFGNDQDTFHRLLKEYLSVKSEYLTGYSGHYYKPYRKAPNFRPGNFINKWISRFEIGSCLQIETPAEGLGIILRLFSGKSDKVGHLLADEGYGISQLVSLLLSLEICIMKGYMDKTIRPRYTIIVEEPEIHLHPKFQSLLADLFWSALYDYRINCIVETHSEYLIRKMQVIASEFARSKNLKDEDMEDNCPIAVYYFPKDRHPYQMDMRSNGAFINDFGAGFFDEAAKLHLQILLNPQK